MKKIICFLILLLCLPLGVFAATTGQATTSANVGQLINIEVAGAESLGDIRLNDHSDIHIMTLVVDNNDDDGYTLTFQSENGATYGVGNNFGYMIHNSASDDTSVTPNAGQKPATRYELLLGENSNTLEYGHATQPEGVVDDCEEPGTAAKFEISTPGGTDVNFNNVDRATRSGYFYVCLTQLSDLQLFHGEYSDTIVVSIADN